MAPVVFIESGIWDVSDCFWTYISGYFAFSRRLGRASPFGVRSDAPRAASSLETSARPRVSRCPPDTERVHMDQLTILPPGGTMWPLYEPQASQTDPIVTAQLLWTYTVTVLSLQQCTHR